jgi:hypothetical protein
MPPGLAITLPCAGLKNSNETGMLICWAAKTLISAESPTTSRARIGSSAAVAKKSGSCFSFTRFQEKEKQIRMSNESRMEIVFKVKK